MPNYKCECATVFGGEDAQRDRDIHMDSCEFVKIRKERDALLLQIERLEKLEIPNLKIERDGAKYESDKFEKERDDALRLVGVLKNALERYASGCEDCHGDRTVDCYCGYARAALKGEQPEMTIAQPLCTVQANCFGLCGRPMPCAEHATTPLKRNHEQPHPPRAEGDLAPPGNAAGDAASVSTPAGPVPCQHEPCTISTCWCKGSVCGKCEKVIPKPCTCLGVAGLRPECPAHMDK